MGYKNKTGSETVYGKRRLDGESLLGKTFSVRRFIIAFFANWRYNVPLLCSKSFQLGLLRRSQYGTLASLKIILRALF